MAGADPIHFATLGKTVIVLLRGTGMSLYRAGIHPVSPDGTGARGVTVGCRSRHRVPNAGAGILPLQPDRRHMADHRIFIDPHLNVA